MKTNWLDIKMFELLYLKLTYYFKLIERAFNLNPLVRSTLQGLLLHSRGVLSLKKKVLRGSIYSINSANR